MVDIKIGHKSNKIIQYWNTKTVLIIMVGTYLYNNSFYEKRFN